MSEHELLEESRDEKNQDERESRLTQIWDFILRAGLGESVFRLGTHALLMALILFFAWGLRHLYVLAQVVEAPRGAALAAAPPTATPLLPVDLPLFAPDFSLAGIPRRVRLHTDVPSRPREQIIKYTVKSGDSLFGIGDKFGIKPETILWANQAVLGDNPHNLRPDQELVILPVDGTYHRWSAGDGLNGVAKFFGVKPEDIIEYPGNHLNPDTIGDYSRPNIEPGTWLIVPGGHREFVNWSAPEIPRDNPQSLS